MPSYEVTATVVTVVVVSVVMTAVSVALLRANARRERNLRAALSRSVNQPLIFFKYCGLHIPYCLLPVRTDILVSEFSHDIRLVTQNDTRQRSATQAPPLAQSRRFPHNLSGEALFLLGVFWLVDHVADGGLLERTAETFSDESSSD